MVSVDYVNFHGDMDMGGMSPNATSTASAAGASGSAAPKPMSMGGGNCKISMLWNWTTVDTCFLSKTWHNKTVGMYAGSVVGVFFLCMAIEAVRRAGREYDRRITVARAASMGEKAARSEPTWVQHLVRTLVYGIQFTGAFLVMLLGMYYNGGILFAIFCGHTIGYYLFGKDTLRDNQIDSGCAC